MQLFYAPDISSDQYTFNEEESKHAIQVLRLALNDKIELTDGKGNFFKAEIVDDNRKRCTVKIVERKRIPALPFNLHIAIAPTKNMERLEWFLEKVTEIGITEITPVICEHSERKELKVERLNKVVVSAMKQSLKAHKPIVNEPVSFKDFLKISCPAKKYIAHCEAGTERLLKNAYSPAESCLILIGPEGDFSENEIKKALEEGFIPVSLGESRLRTETAGVVACHTVNLLNQ